MRDRFYYGGGYKIKHFRNTLVAFCFTSAFLLSLSHATVVRDDIPYQTYRDFAENKGIFVPGATNIEIKDKNGNLIGVLNKAPMPDFSSVVRQSTSIGVGEATLYQPSYMITAAHVKKVMKPGDKLYFGYDNSDYDYSLVSWYTGPNDLATLRLDKLVTEVAPAQIGSTDAGKGAFAKGGDYSAFYRVGSGKKAIVSSDLKFTEVGGDFLLGGTLPFLTDIGNKGVNADFASFFNVDVNGPLSNAVRLGDSGSPIFGYNTKNNRWELIGVLSTGSDWTGQWATTSTNKFVNNQPNDETIAFSGSFTKDKNLVFYNSGETKLDSNIDSGYGFLQFKDDYRVTTDNNSSWKGAGIITDKDAEVTWQVNGVQGDNLHKIGEGTLVVEGNGDNKGGLKVGDGLVVLNQRGGRAFNNINIASGRATVRLQGENQIEPDNISFGYRGGKLDVNGHDIAFDKQIKASDFGAEITNNSDKKSTITLDYKNISIDDIPNPTIPNVNFLSSGSGNIGDLYFDTDTKKYLILKKSVFTALTLNNPDYWETLNAKNANEAIEIWKQRQITTDNSPILYHGKFTNNLDVIISELSGKEIGIDGSIDIAGDLSKTGGELIFQGHPLLHAGAKPSATQSDWETRNFTMSNLILNDAKFYLSQDSILSGDIQASNSNITLGSDRIMLDNNEGTGLDVSASITTATTKLKSEYQGIANLDKSTLNVANARFRGGIRAKDSTIAIDSNDVVFESTLTLQNSKMSLNKDSKVVANAGIISKNSDGANGVVELNSNANLTLRGNADSNKKIYYAGDFNLKDNSSLTIENKAEVSGDIAANNASNIKINNSSFSGGIDAKLALVDIDGLASWSITKDSNLASMKSNASIINFGNLHDNYYTLTLDNLNTTDSYYVMRTDLKSSDKIIVNKSLTGKRNTIYVDFKNNNLTGQQVELIKAPTGIDKDVFDTTNQLVGITNVTPILEVRDDGKNTSFVLNGYQTNINKQAISSVNAMSASGYRLFTVEMNNINKRMGDIRDSGGIAGFWARYMLGNGSGDDGYENKYNHIQIGIDKRSDFSSLDLFTGLTLSYTANNIELDNAFDGNSNAIGIGAYISTLFNNGLYLDLIGKYIFQDNKYVYFNPGSSNKFNTHSLYADVELGYKIKLPKDFFITPQAELAYGRIGGNTINLSNEILVNNDYYNALVGRVGLDLGESVSGDDWKMTTKIGASYQFDILNDNRTIISDSFTEMLIKAKRDARFLLGIGMAFELGEQIRIGIDYEKSFGGIYNIDNELNLRARYSF